MLNTGINTKAILFIGRKYACSSADNPKIASRQFVLPVPYGNKDINNYCVSITFTSQDDALNYVPYVQKDIGEFKICFAKKDGRDINIGYAIWFDLIIAINSTGNVLG